MKRKPAPAPAESTLDALEAEIERLQAELDKGRAARREADRQARNEGAMGMALNDPHFQQWRTQRDLQRLLEEDAPRRKGDR